MNDILERGRALAQSARNIAFAGPELDSMLNAIWDQLVSEAGLGRVDEAPSSKRWKDKWLHGAYGYNAHILDIVQGVEGKGKRLGTVSMLVRLCGDPTLENAGVTFPWQDQACLFIGWHNVPDHLDDYWDGERFEARTYNATYIRHVKDGLWSWKTEEEKQTEEEDVGFFFVLPLFAIQSENDIRKKVIAPLTAFFQTSEPAKIAAEVLKGIPVLTP